MARAIVWQGAEQMRKWLVPLVSLERFPRNPRRGKVADIAASLSRFGQTRPILTDGKRIVAGNHTYLAAESLGWTHIAAVPNAFDDEGEARAYLLADNRLPELGSYDRDALVAALSELEESGEWEGTGYAIDDLEDLREAAEMERAAFRGGFSADAGELERRAAALAGGRAMKEIILTLTAAQADQFLGHIKILGKEYGDGGGVTETVYRAVAEQARRLNQGEPDAAS